MAQPTLHLWLRPRLEILLHEAAAAGFATDAALAVIIDLATSDAFNSPPMPTESQLPQAPGPSPPNEATELAEVGLHEIPNLLGGWRHGN